MQRSQDKRPADYAQSPANKVEKGKPLDFGNEQGTSLTIESVEITKVEKSAAVDSDENLIVDDQRNALQSEEILSKFNVVTEEA